MLPLPLREGGKSLTVHNATTVVPTTTQSMLSSLDTSVPYSALVRYRGKRDPPAPSARPDDRKGRIYSKIKGGTADPLSRGAGAA